MPAAHPSANKFLNQRLAHAASNGMLITVCCPYCRRRVHFWAADLAKVLGPDHELHVPPFPCSRCRTRELDVKWCIPSAADLENLTVRRPVRQVVKWIWKDERA